MMGWALAVMIDCAQPRLPFRTFYERIYAGPYPGVMGEDLSVVTRRSLDTVANYADYAEQYRDKCK